MLGKVEVIKSLHNAASTSLGRLCQKVRDSQNHVASWHELCFYDIVQSHLNMSGNLSCPSMLSDLNQHHSSIAQWHEYAALAAQHLSLRASWSISALKWQSALQTGEFDQAGTETAYLKQIG